MTESQERLICFDLGGVLIQICRSWEEGCQAAGLEADRGWAPSMSGGRHHEIVWNYTTGVIETEAFFVELESLAQGMYSADDFRRIHRAWTRDEYPGVTPLLHELRDAGRRLACLSNTNAAHWDVLLEQPAMKVLHDRHASHLIGHAKPDDRIYEWFSTTMRMAPWDIVFFDDLQENVQVAKRLGWDAVQIDHMGDTTAQIRSALRARSLL